MANNTSNPDLKIAQSKTLKNIDEISDGLGLPGDRIEHYGRYKAKIPIELID